MKTKYILITPAYNEENYIECTIRSVVEQTITPVLYVIVSDGSTDKTDIIVKQYAKEYNFIRLIRRETGNKPNFSSKVFAFNSGYNEIKSKRYDFLGNLDADVSFNPDYYEKLLSKFNDDEKLGIAGGSIWDVFNGKIKKHKSMPNSVAGATMMFRKECYHSIGGYIPLEYGGEDSTAEITARSKGWKVITFSDITMYHHKPIFYKNKNAVIRRFNKGRSLCLLGYHPLFLLVSSFYRVGDKPYIIGTFLIILGYIYERVKNKPKILSRDVILFLQNEQITRLKKTISIKSFNV